MKSEGDDSRVAVARQDESVTSQFELARKKFEQNGWRMTNVNCETTALNGC